MTGYLPEPWKKIGKEQENNKSQAIRENELIKGNKRHKAESKIEIPQNPNKININEATCYSLDYLELEYDKVRSTGGSTGVRVWMSKEPSKEELSHLHELIVKTFKDPVALSVLDYQSERTLYNQGRPVLLSHL